MTAPVSPPSPGAVGLGTPVDGGAATPTPPPPAARRRGLLGRLREALAIPLDARGMPALDGVRAIAASLVFVVHYQAAFGDLLVPHPRAAAAADFAGAVGYHGVSVFFVLSGFLIYGSLLARPVQYGRFFVRRVRRIYPTYLAVLALYLLLGELFRSRSKLPDTGVLAFVLKNALLLPGVFRMPAIITVSWSLSYEVFFYLGLATAVALLGLRRWPPAWRWGLLAALVVAWVLGGAAAQRLVRTFIMFLPGIALWEYRRWRGARPGPAWLGAPLAWTLFAIALVGVPLLDTHAAAERLTPLGLRPSQLAFFLLALGVVPLLDLAASGRTGAATALSWPPLRRLGVMSYSFYLLHGLTINACALLFWAVAGRGVAQGARGPALYLALVAPVYVAALGTSAVLFRLVERRFSF